ncbi:hypothetical protein Q5Y75_27000 [Ruegeria sp. 2205SS24-7]|uniref:hypothetical protein n=1 Tax=Ruegeria discodermiae TaxID=3064389 RepID=UPI002740EC44|nr:hypothetical protein [Ruegeria sp. 2205SS24-7]MDP5220840.1 hypothetical protein [Ruegeria sp. 2205SS24-7]
MSGLSTSPKLVKGGIVLVDPQTAAVRKVVALQYNPEKMSRTFQVKRMVEGADHAEALRLTGPAVETYSIEADIDAADKLEFPDQHSATVAAGIAPEIAVLESLVNPKVADLRAYEQLANAGTLEIAPVEGDLQLLVWGPNRIVPGNVTEFSVNEEAYDPQLNPIRAKVTIGFRVLTVDDLGYDSKGGGLFMAYLEAREKLASKAATFGFETLGIGGVT